MFRIPMIDIDMIENIDGLTVVRLKNGLEISLQDATRNNTRVSVAGCETDAGWLAFLYVTYDNFDE